MAPDAEILPRSRSRHLLRQETGAPALRKATRWRSETEPGRVEARTSRCGRLFKYDEL